MISPSPCKKFHFQMIHDPIYQNKGASARLATYKLEHFAMR